jgi:hypothetical protein
MITRKDILKESLLKHYSRKEPHPFYQIDCFCDTDPDDVFRGDENGDSLTFGTTHELMSGWPSVRVLITPKAELKDVARALKKIRKWVKNADNGAWSAFRENLEDLNQEVCHRCGALPRNQHHKLCESSLSTGDVQEAIRALEGSLKGDYVEIDRYDEIPF